MLKALLVIFVLIYAHNIWQHYFTFAQVKRCLKKVTSFLGAYSADPYNCDYELIMLLKCSDIISRYVFAPTLHCKDSDAEIFSRSELVHSELWMVKNRKWHDFLRSLNPLPSVKDTVLLPVTVLSWLGFQPKKIPSLLLSVAGWAIAYLFDMFQPELKELIAAAFEQLVK